MAAKEEGLSPWAMRLGMILLALMFLSLFKSCQEFRYALGGRPYQGTVHEIKERTGRYGRVVGYSLACRIDDPDNQLRITGHVPIGIDEVHNYQVGQPIQIEYIGRELADFDARLQGRRYYFWVVLFFTFLFLLIGGFVWGCIHWNRVNAADQRGRSPAPRKRR